MAEKKAMNANVKHAAQAGKAKAPDWAQGLRRLYDSVVEEPLPDDFARLLDELDKGNDA